LEPSSDYIKDYYRKRSKKMKVSARHLKILSLVPPLIANRSVLDVGCGNRFITTCMSIYAPSIKGIDIDDDILTYKSDVQYDVVTCFDVFEHLTNLQKALDNIKNLCKANGLIIVNQPEMIDKKQPIDNIVPIEKLMCLGKLVYLENYRFSKQEFYNFMVFQCV